MTVQYAELGRTATALAVGIERAIVEGALAPGDLLPTVRTLSREAGVSPTTAAAAYRTLRQRGLVATHGRNGTTVSPRPPLAGSFDSAPAAALRNLAGGNPDVALLADLRTVLHRLEPTPQLYGGVGNRPSLLARAADLFAHDGIPAQHLAITGGALDGIERALQAHLRPGDRIAVEDPGYPPLFDLLAALGLVPEPIALDAYGLRPDALAPRLGHVAAVLVTPRAQNPTGAALDAARAAALSDLFDAHPDLLVLEDDHAGPVAGAAAFTTAHPGRRRWATLRSMSKPLAPDLRLAFVAGDALTIARIEGRQRLGTGWVSHLLQQVVEMLLADPATPDLWHKAARSYARRRRAVIDALIGHGIEATGDSGLNVWVPVPAEAPAVAGMAAAGWAIQAGERFRHRSPAAVRLTVAGMAEDEAPAVAAALAQLLAAPRRRSLA
ncbi:MAG: aminotransferase class I/II-fold pyridoxal phosphate-dependent enzyme [Alphaproteobacteria bacterium]